MRARPKCQRRIDSSTGHHFCGDDHRKHCPPYTQYAPWSVAGNKISQCAEPLCNMSSWHHENAIPNGEHKIVGSRTTRHYGGPSDTHSTHTRAHRLLLVSGLPLHSLYHLPTTHSLAHQRERSSDHITHDSYVFLHPFCVPRCESDPLRMRLVCDFIYLFVNMFVVRYLFH